MSQIAKQLNLAESTARFYRDRFEDYIPSVGEGRKKRYRSETIEVLRFIAEGFKRNLTAMDIQEGLSHMVARNIEIETETAITPTATQQQPENELKQYASQLQIAFEQMSATMKIVADQKEEIAELRKHISNIESKLEEQDPKLLIESIKELQETKQKIAATLQKKWWQFWK